MRGREVVITGMGVVSPIANELNLFWEGLKAGQSGIARVESMEDIDQYPVQIAGEVRDLEVEKYVEAKEARKMDPYTVYGMAAASMAVMNVSGDQLIEIAAEAGCFVANFNSLSQTVLSGRVEMIEKAEALAKEAGAKRTVRLPVAGAFHSPLMASAAKKMDSFLSSIVFQKPHTPVVSNVTGCVHEFEHVQARMVEQIVSSVRWVACVEFLVSAGVQHSVECGPGKVLAGLIKRIDKNIEVRNISNISEI